MIVAVTGGTGFIGKKLVERLVKRGDTVRLLTRNPTLAKKSALLEMYECDLVKVEINELSSMLEGVDVFYHCAGQLVDVAAMQRLHVDATQKLVEAAFGRVKHWVQLSSVGVYGPVSAGIVTEETPLNPVGDYEITKAESDRIVIDAANRGAFSYSILRPSNVFGADMRNQSLFGMVDMINKGLFFFIGKPGASANYIHVDNVIDGLVRCGSMSAARGRIYNISDHRTIEDFVAIISQVLHKSKPCLRVSERWARKIARMTAFIPSNPLTEQRVNAMVKRAIYSTAKLEAELGYRHVVSMEAGLIELTASWRHLTDERSPV